MKGLHYHNEVLHMEDVPLDLIEQDVETPFYAYSHKVLTDNYKEFESALKNLDAQICFAIKACSNLSIISLLGKLGSGIDAVSIGEIKRALKAHISPDKIVFSGVGKTEKEIQLAIMDGISQFNVESKNELMLVDKIAGNLANKVRIAIRINPNVEAGTLDRITTGKKENKFGIDIDEAEEIFAYAGRLKNIDLKGISTHIGSQILELEPFRNAYTKIRDLFSKLNNQGFSLDTIDLGGGVGVKYDQENPIDLKEYGNMVYEIFKNIPVKLIFEPGRRIAAESGVLVTKVIYVKKTKSRNFIVVDAAMNDLMRHSLYDAYHQILPVLDENHPMIEADIVGPVCESTDIFTKNIKMKEPKEGDLLAFMTAGAYGAAMSSTYNSRPLIPEVLIKERQFQIVRKRWEVEDMLKLENLAKF